MKVLKHLMVLDGTFAKRRMFEYGKSGYSYEDCLQISKL